MKKLFLLLTLVAHAFAGTAFAEDTGIPVAVFDFNTPEDALVGTASKITALTTANLSTNSHLMMLERVELTKSIQELSLGLSGSVNAEDAAKVGHMSGAKVLVTGQVFKHGKDQIVIMADIIGTETSRLYVDTFSTHYPCDVVWCAKVITGKIEKTILGHSTNLVLHLESRENTIDKIVKSAKPGKRPVVLFHLAGLLETGQTNSIITADAEMGYIFQKAGFSVVDGKSDQKPEIEIMGDVVFDCASKGNDLFFSHATIEAKVQDRTSGKIIAFDRQEGSAMDIGRNTSAKAAAQNAADELAARLVPLLTQ